MRAAVRHSNAPFVLHGQECKNEENETLKSAIMDESREIQNYFKESEWVLRQQDKPLIWLETLIFQRQTMSSLDGVGHPWKQGKSQRWKLAVPPTHCPGQRAASWWLMGTEGHTVHLATTPRSRGEPDFITNSNRATNPLVLVSGFPLELPGKKQKTLVRQIHVSALLATSTDHKLIIGIWGLDIVSGKLGECESESLSLFWDHLKGAIL